MKKIYLLFLILFAFTTSVTVAQSSHDKISYQSVVRDGSNHLLYDTQVTVAVSIKNSGDPAVKYSETHTVTSNANGLISFLIGDGNSPSGNWDAVQWNRAEITMVTSVGGVVLSTHTLPLSAVPYALYAKNAGAASYADSVDINVVKHYVDQQGFLTEEVQVLSISNDTIFLTGGSWVKLPAGFSGDYNDLINKPDLKPVATSGDYNDLVNKPDINNATLMIQKNGTGVGTFTANASEDKAINITVPTKVSDLTNDSGYITGYTETDPEFTAWDKDYNDLINTPPIPAAANDAKLVIKKNGTEIGSFTANASENDTVNIEVPTKVSDLTNDSGYITGYTETDPTVKNSKITIQKNGTEVKSFTLNQSSDETINITVPDAPGTLITTNTASLTPPTDGEALSGTVNLHKVSKTGSYNDLNDKPTNVSDFTNDANYVTTTQMNDQHYLTAETDPTVNDATLTIKVSDGTAEGSYSSTAFTANDATDKTVTLAKVAGTGRYNDLNDKPTNLATTDGNNTFTGTNDFTSSTARITVPSKFDIESHPSATTPCTQDAVNICDLWAVFDSLNKRMDNILKTIDTLKHVNDSLSQELEALRPALKITGPTNMSFCDGSNAATFTATITNANAEDYTYSWSVNGSAQSSTGTNMTFSPNTTGSYKVVCTATRPGYDITLKDSITVNVSAGGVLPSAFGLCKEGLAVTVMISDDNISSILWGDGGTTSDVTTNSYHHDYSTSNGASTYTITALTPQGCSVSRTITLSETTTRPCTVYSPHTNTTEYTSTTGGLETLVDGKVVSVQDQDGHSYFVTQIGDQCWMRTNLRTTKYNDGTTIPGGVSYSGYSRTEPYHYISPSYNDSIYGYFYNWPAAAHRNSSNRLDLCPKGWHVPSQADLETLLSEAGVTTPKNTGTGAVYLAGGCNWELYTSGVSSVTPNSYENPDRDKWDFTAIPAGSSISSTFVGNGAGVYFWSSTEFDADHAKTLYIGAGYTGVENDDLDKENGRLVRCVRDEGSTPLPTLSISHNPENLTVCGGNPLVVTYTATPSEGEIGDYSYSWSDGTNVISTEATCEITYNSAGDFSVVCTATHTDDGYDITADNNITVNSADAPRFAFAVDTTSVIIKVITEGASITDWGGNGTTGGSASFPCVAVFNYSTSGIYNITATNSTSGCATTRRVAVGEATLHPCAVSSAHPAQTGITGDGLETTVSSQDSITTVADYDGNVYAVVQIGTQCWLKSNLRARHFSDGTQIVNGTEAGTVTNDCLLNATSTTVPYYYRPENNSCGRDYSAGVMSNSFGKVSGAYNEKLYGLYYNWSAVMDNKGICPHGWHVPTQAEWNTMIGVVVSENGAESDKYAYLLSEGNDWDSQEYDWNTNSSDPQYKPGWFVELRNASEFSAVLTGLAGGSDSEHGTTDALGRFLNRAHSYAESYFWSSTSNGNDRAVSINLSHLGTQLTFNNKSINSGYSVRCVRDGESGGGVVSDDPTLSVTSDATAPLSVCGSTSASVTYTASITNGETGDYNYTWNSVPAGTVDPNHDNSYSVTYTTPGTYTISCTATPKENVTAVDPATMSVTVTVGGCPCTVTSVGTNEVEGSETNTISAVKDAQDQQYRVVKIGSQCWMAQNLRSTSGLTQGTSSSSTDPYYYDNTNSTFALEDRGIYYNWPAVMGDNSASNTNPSGVQGICPSGWHVPSKAEWEQLETYLTQNNNYWCGNDFHNISKAMASTVGWSSSANSCTPGNDMSGNNTTGFNALPVGDYQANFGNAGLYADFWTSTMSGDNPYHYSITTDQSEPAVEATISPYNKDFGLSVRCVRDAESGGSTPTQPSVTTSAATDVTSTTATLAGTITDPDNLVVTKGFQWRVENEDYELGNDVTIDGDDNAMTYTLTNLSPSTKYYYRAFASIATTPYMVYGQELYFTTTSAEPVVVDCGTVTDADGNTYNTVMIGSQCWMKENLRTTKYSDNTDITTYYDYSTSDIPLERRGYLYDWNVTMNQSGSHDICPIGWHVPSLDEWESLNVSEYQCNGNIARAMAANTDWYVSTAQCQECEVCYDLNNNNSSGFSAIPAGFHKQSGFDEAGSSANFWTSSINNSYNEPRYVIIDIWSGYRNTSDPATNGYSVRCVRDGEASVTTSSAVNISTTGAWLRGNVVARGNTIVEKGFYWKATEDGTYVKVTSTGGTLTHILGGLTASTNYTYYAFATTPNGTVYGTEVSFTTLEEPSVSNCGTVTDVDGNTYNTVMIESQCWMKENLRTKGTLSSFENVTNPSVTPFYYQPTTSDFAEYTVPTYGLYYNRSAALNNYDGTGIENPSNNIQGICPTGWHIPSKSEWQTLKVAVGNSPCKLAGSSDWSGNDWGENDMSPGNYGYPYRNQTGFTALPSGRFDVSSGTMDNNTYPPHNHALFWSSSFDDNATYYLRLWYYDVPFYFETCGNDYAFPVRCVRD